ncbi:hypothetical protein BALOs_2729 [Halobacteriovorax sp. BALOs_7]|uniref:hypothetical protein n=1 Tax=Halobacteriovorax sp. BALOs_7 TaxID=2109558 RepID=UPI000EA1709F|nr:hypothetical protein [Halobacteriovorax sp. BALOs_7]AYF45719.1 hypothetical protein BALOs_2729 [Halobacteriovorax sp. BALOs_7]
MSEVSVELDWFEGYIDDIELSEVVTVKRGRRVFAKTTSIYNENYLSLDRNLYAIDSLLPRSFGYNEATGRLKIALSSSSCRTSSPDEGFTHLNFESQIESFNNKNDFLILNSEKLKSCKLKVAEIKVDVSIEKIEEELGVDIDLLPRVLAHGSLMQFKTPVLRGNGVQYSNNSHSRVPYNKKKQIEENSKLRAIYEEEGIKIPNIHREDIRIKTVDKCKAVFGEGESFLRSALYIPKMVDVVLPYFEQAKIKTNFDGSIVPNFEDKVMSFASFVELSGGFSKAITNKGYMSILSEYGSIDIARNSLERLSEILKSKGTGDKSFYRWMSKLVEVSTLNSFVESGANYKKIFEMYHHLIVRELKDVRSKYINKEIVSLSDTHNLNLTSEEFYDASDCINWMNANDSLLSHCKDNTTPKGIVR